LIILAMRSLFRLDLACLKLKLFAAEYFPALCVLLILDILLQPRNAGLNAAIDTPEPSKKAAVVPFVLCSLFIWVSRTSCS